MRTRLKRLLRPHIWVHRIIWINVIVYFAWHLTYPEPPDFMIQNFLVSFQSLSEGRFWGLITSAFSHAMFWHLFFNMYVLLSFGSIIEDLLGTKGFLAFYLVAGAVSSLSHALVSAFIVGKPELPALGASGAISGLILVFSLVFPRQIILLFGIIPIPAFIGAFLFVGLDIWGLVAQAGGGGLSIGHGAHLGGALTGIVFYFWILRPRLLALRKAEVEAELV